MDRVAAAGQRIGTGGRIPDASGRSQLKFGRPLNCIDGHPDAGHIDAGAVVAAGKRQRRHRIADIAGTGQLQGQVRRLAVPDEVKAVRGRGPIVDVGHRGDDLDRSVARGRKRTLETPDATALVDQDGVRTERSRGGQCPGSHRMGRLKPDAQPDRDDVHHQCRGRLVLQPGDGRPAHGEVTGPIGKVADDVGHVDVKGPATIGQLVDGPTGGARRTELEDLQCPADSACIGQGQMNRGRVNAAQGVGKRHRQIGSGNREHLAGPAGGDHRRLGIQRVEGPPKRRRHGIAGRVAPAIENGPIACIRLQAAVRQDGQDAVVGRPGQAGRRWHAVAVPVDRAAIRDNGFAEGDLNRCSRIHLDGTCGRGHHRHRRRRQVHGPENKFHNRAHGIAIGIGNGSVDHQPIITGVNQDRRNSLVYAAVDRRQHRQSDRLPGNAIKVLQPKPTGMANHPRSVQGLAEGEDQMGVQRHGGFRPGGATRPIGDRVDGRRGPVQSQDAQVNPCSLVHIGHRHGQS